METVVITPNADVLRNRGFLLELHKLKKAPGSDVIAQPVQRIYTEANEPVFEQVWFKFTNASLAECELDPPFGFAGLDNLGDQLNTRPVLSVSKVFAIVFEHYVNGPDNLPVPDWKLAALLMKDGDIMKYAAAMTGALQMAQGMDPKDASEVVQKMLRQGKEEIEKAVHEGQGILTLPSEVSPGTDSSKDGQSSTETGTSSGV